MLASFSISSELVPMMNITVASNVNPARTMYADDIARLLYGNGLIIFMTFTMKLKDKHKMIVMISPERIFLCGSKSFKLVSFFVLNRSWIYIQKRTSRAIIATPARGI